MRPFRDLTRQKFGSLGVLAYAGVDKYGRRRWRVYCECCGSDQKIVLAQNLLSGATTSCGCIGREKARQRMKAFLLIEKAMGQRAMAGWATPGAEGLISKIAADARKTETTDKS